MLLITSDTIPGASYKALGLARGNVVVGKTFARNAMASLKNLAGGEVMSYTMLLDDARKLAEKRLIDDARAMHADAVVGVRFEFCSMASGTVELLCYGTAIAYTQNAR